MIRELECCKNGSHKIRREADGLEGPVECPKCGNNMYFTQSRELELVPEVMKVKGND